ncbi:MAG: CRISPR system precrRNA processing endoribonuclease RAMP protein Cas6 [Peptococcaceae bacterium]|nr:CRISPR system precrRNA processing endoribonuclease RAMP protein Cas6 [Candidatus Syntrophopropionicum ammoniitolerans]
MQNNFHVAKYELSLEAGREGLTLPPYKGSTLRGGFGAVFKRIACSLPRTQCRACLLQPGCPYAYIFETAPPPGSEALRSYSSIPRPFVLEPPLETKTEYAPGEKLCFHLLLVGKAIGYLPYFIVAFRELGEVGIGRQRKKFQLHTVKAIHPVSGAGEIIYQAADQMIKNMELAWIVDAHQLAAPAADIPPVHNVGLEFQTMTRLKFADKYAQRVEFHVLMRSLLRRISSLAYFHHGWEPELDFTGLIDRAAAVCLVQSQTRWVDWERYSSRQSSRMNMGGVVGQVEYRGDLGAYMPLLRLGQLVHVGKGAVFGMGKYAIC